MLEALDAVGLGAWIRGLPEGLATPVGEDGGTVSGGQRRRIALARALLADTDVLLVEPTAHLDPELAQRVLDALTNHARSRGQSLLAIVRPGVALDRFDWWSSSVAASCIRSPQQRPSADAPRDLAGGASCFDVASGLKRTRSCSSAARVPAVPCGAREDEPARMRAGGSPRTRR